MLKMIFGREEFSCQPVRLGFLVMMLCASTVGLALDGSGEGANNLIAPEVVPDGPQMVQVGAETKELFETEHPYLGPTTDELQLVWSAEIFSPLASYVCPHFSRFELAKGDFVVVRSADGSRSWSYEGTGKGDLGLTDGFWAVHIPGELAVVELYSRNEVGAYGLTIDRFAHGFPLSSEDLPPVIPEAICGTDDSEWAKCYTGSEPVKYDKGRAVARLLINGTGACTGWLVGSEGHVVTNNHCIGTSTDAANTNFEFMAEGAACSTNCASWLGCPGTLVATSSTLVQTSAAIDYALVQLPSNPTATYGFFQLRKEGGITNEEIYIPQHPQAWGKRIAVYSDNAADPTGYAELSLNASNGSAMVWLYFADTQGGSSGSPVVASTDNMVVALHHGAYDCSTYGNGGPEVEELISDLGGNLPQDAILYSLDVTVGGLGSGTVVSSPSGIDCPAGTCEADFGNDSTVILTPTAGSHSVFGGWSGDADCADGTVTMTSDVSCTATFDVDTHTLSVATAGTGGGTVTSSPSGINCPGDCSEDYDHGQSVTLTPTPDGGSTFTGWSGDADCSDGTVTINSNVSCTAAFDTGVHTLSIATAGAGGGTVTSSPSGINCPGDCSEDYDYGQSVTLTATPDGTSTFAGWSGDADCSDGTVTMNSGVSCTATFDVTTHTLSVATAGTGGGAVTSSPSGINCPGDCSEDYDHGQSVTLTATPDGTSTFAGWSGDADCSDGTVTMNSGVSCTATFDVTTHTLSVATVGSGGGTVTSSPSGINCPGDCGEDYDHGQSVTLTPTPDGTSTFAGWSGDADCSDGTVTMNSDVSCTATFDVATHTLSVAMVGSGGGTVTSSPSGINCPGDCSEDYDHGQSVTLTPTPDGTSTFAGWSGDADCSDGTVTINSDVSCTATFDVTTHTLSIATAGTGGGAVTSSPSGINCPGDCSEDYDHGQSVTLTPTPDGTSTFAGWSGDADCSDGTVTINSDVSCTATFTEMTADLYVTKTDGVIAAPPGGSVIYTIVAANSGPSDTSSVSVTDAFPADLTCSWTSVASGGASGNGTGSGAISETLTLPGGAAVTYTATCFIDSAASGTLSNSASIAGALPDPVPGNNTATDNDTVLVPEADLSITKNDGVCEANPGDTLNYSITVANAGPSDAVGATVNDVFPAELTGCSWTAVAVGGASGAGSGSGDINESVNLPSGSSISYTATCTVDPSSSFERLANTATVAAPVGTTEPDISDNSSTDANVGPLAVFGGCFESGTTTRWSETVGEV